MNDCNFCNNFSIVKLLTIELQFEIILKQPLLHATVLRDKVSSTVSGLQRWTPINYQFNKYCSQSLIIFHSFIYYQGFVVTQSKPNSLHIDSAKDTCLVPLSHGTKIPHRRYHQNWNILVDERIS